MASGYSIVKLVHNRRSHGAIVAWSNMYMYENDIRAIGARDTGLMLGSTILPNPTFPIVFHGHHTVESRDALHSVFNEEEARLVAKYCHILVNDTERRIGTDTNSTPSMDLTCVY